jgi:pimeloyl-ACP methyl ester carboxylesterase
VSEAVEPFTIQVPETDLVELARRLAATRLPDQVGDDWRYGTPVAYLRSLIEYWRDGFDWRAHEAQLNRFAQFRARIDGRWLHFVHQRSTHAHARPLLICHGWPGSFAEFRHVIGPLTQPELYGGDPADAFHVVAPSIPGYGFSEASRAPGFHPKACAACFAELMAMLGYSRYHAQGGDWGSAIVSWLAALEREKVAGIHLNLVFAAPPASGSDPMAGVSVAERQRLEARRAFLRDEVGYQQIQSTKPQTLGYALNDSPAGLAAWIVEKFHGWTDNAGDLEAAVSRDDVLTNISIYWFTGTITSSIRLYYENRQFSGGLPVPERVDVPTAVACFPVELYQPPRAWVEQRYRLVRWTEMSAGGHFAALEQPRAWVEDVRAACREAHAGD